MLFGLFLGSISLLVSCGGAGQGGSAASSGDGELLRVEVGRLVDVFGLKGLRRNEGVVLFQKDVLIGPDIQDDRRGANKKSEAQIVYEFIGVDPDTLQSRLLINREVGSEKFQSAWAKLGENLIRIAPGHFGQNTKERPFAVAARNGAIQLTFNKDLGISEDFFVAKDELGRVIGIKNPEAVQVLEIVGDPNDNDPSGDFRLIPTRIAYKGDQIVLDPVLLGSEGTAFNVPNNALGLPESSDSSSANIRLALTLEGPLRIRGLRADDERLTDFLGRNLANQKSIIRDFRSGNDSDNDSRISRGFVRDTVPPRLVGEMAMRLEAVDKTLGRLLVYKAGISHEIDIGDVLKLFPTSSEGRAVAITDVVVDPDDDRDKPSEQHVFVEVRDVSTFEPFDPTETMPPEILNASREIRESWLVENAPILVLSTEFSQESDDDIRNFVNFTPPPVPSDPKKPTPNENVSPFASLIVRFSKPVDLTSVKPLDSLVLATEGKTTTVLDPKLGTPFLFFSQIFDEDGSQTSLRITPPLGLYLDDALRKENLPYFLHLRGGVDGIKDLSGNPVDFQTVNKAEEFQVFPFFLDVRVKNGVPAFPDNRVVNICKRFLARDEDESPPGQIDFFGAVTVFDGMVQGRPTARTTSYVDDLNQLSSPPEAPFRFCPVSADVLLTAATPFPQPILNPLNPWGCRLMTVWREIDLSLSRTDPFDFNLDIEAMWYTPFQQGAMKTRPFTFDIFDKVSLFIGHSERRPTNCVSKGGALPMWPQSGLRPEFWHNFARNLKATATSRLDKQGVSVRPKEHTAFKDKVYTIRDQDSVFEPNKTNRFIPLPDFEKPYLTWRDERLAILGGGAGNSQILSPFGKGTNKVWNGFAGTPFQEDGRVGTIALPLLADFWVLPDEDSLPKENPWGAIGINGWQVSLTVQSSPKPDFRVYSAGGIKNGQNRSQGIKVSPANATKWQKASGGINPTNGFGTPCCDNVTYWTRVDFLKRISLMTYGFVKLKNPHNSKDRFNGDPRLGGQTGYDLTNALPRFEVAFDPPLSSLPFGTKIIAEYRGAHNTESDGEFPIKDAYDPLLTGNAHIRYYRNSENRFYRWEHTRKLTEYTRDPRKLVNPDFLRPYDMTPREMDVFNFRFIFENNVEATPPVTPSMDSYVLMYRLEKN